MYEPSPRRGPSTSSEWWIAIVFVLILLGLFTAEMLDNYRPAKLAALLVVLFWIPLLALHEMGHAIAAFLLGWRVSQIVIGMGKTIGRFRLGTTPVEIRVWPVEGFVRCAPMGLRFPRLESALIYFAGPGIELLLAVSVLFLIGPDRLLASSEHYGLIAWQSLALAATIQAGLNLIPFAVVEHEGAMYSDGLGIIISFLRPRSYYAQMMNWVDDSEQRNDLHDPADQWKRGK